ncbi:hemolysin activation/secretion protein [Elusimicrobium posterum]|uniref:ShlB/FhaC/HecB family hemolysin secretion/activation protein n=1 Tax=Elusimicrobium posterum TaxID=3116653 RepID=UPI003C738627
MKKILMFLFLILASFSALHAQLSLADEIQRRQQQQSQDMLRQRELDAVRKAQDSEVEFNLSAPAVTGGSEGCFDVVNVRISGVVKLNPKKVRQNVLKHIKSCMAKDDLQQLQSEVQKMYVDKGYIGARVYFDFTNVKQKLLDVVVDEGFVEDIVMADAATETPLDNFRARWQIADAFPYKKGKILNLRHIEQGLDQINKLSSNNAVMDVRPGDKEGGSVIFINNNKSATTQLTAGYDNSGQSSTGRYKGNISISQDNLFSINDNLFLNASSTLWNNRDLRYSDSYTASLRVPLGYWTLSNNFSYSKYLTTTKGSVSSFESSGDSTSNTFAVERMFLRGSSYKLSLGAQLTVKDSKNYLEDVFLDTSSRLLSTGSVYATGTYYSRWGSFFGKLTYNRGLDIFGSEKDENIQYGQPRAQFDSFALYLNYSKDFWKVNYTVSVDSQYSGDDLFSSEQMMIGGEGTVRGFRENSISGEKGFYIRNDFRIPLTEILGESNNPFITAVLTQTYAGVFADYGYVKPQTFGDGGSMAGAGAKLTYYGRYINGGFAYSRSISSPSYIDDEGNIFYFNISLSLSF